ncbi:MAG: DUF1700 domain-containing protein [Lachnospiraceae bacterium]|nr:DUF1700 domain-containing protein [Lachnospiraceae bacterium]
MSKQEFLDQLRRNISSMNDYVVVNDTMAYYEDYIESQIRMGKSEQEVMAMLGDPRLIAKSILATQDAKQNLKDSNIEEEEKAAREKVFTRKGKTYRIPYLLYQIIIALVICVVIFAAFSLLAWMAPVIVIAVLSYMTYKFIKSIFY